MRGRDERFEDCTVCDERFVGDEAIAHNLREQPLSGAPICLRCLKQRKQALNKEAK